MFDSYNREITYLRISITDQCNLRCRYCMPDTETQERSNTTLPLDDIVQIVTTGASLGITKVRLTGGEPLLHSEIFQIISKLRQIEGIKDIGLTTNGILLEKTAQKLKDSGLKRINVSLDTLNQSQYKSLTQTGNLEKVLLGLKKAREVGFAPIKINVVRTDLIEEQDRLAIKEFCKQNSFHIRFIQQMDLTTGEFSVVEGGDGGNCKICNRLRIMANGDVKPCLFSNKAYNIREFGIKNALLMALKAKPEKGTVNNNHQFYTIGG